MRLVLVTGLSGAGRTTALKAFEDLGWFCIDNLPPALLPGLADLLDRTPKADDRVVVGIDVREGRFWPGLEPALREILRRGSRPEIIFLEAAGDELIKRFGMTRRRPPLAVGSDSVAEGLQKERALLEPLRSQADRVIDTTGFSVHDLRSHIVRQYGGENLDEKSLLAVTIVSFAYRNGIPPDASFIFDVRFLPNPYWIDSLRDRTGLDQSVYDYVLGQPAAAGFVSLLDQLQGVVLPAYAHEGRSQITIAFGCTGGQHRSVVMARWLEKRLSRQGYQVRTRHRDLAGV